IDESYDYVLTSSNPEANLQLFEKVRQRFKTDTIVVPVWMGLLNIGAAELGTRFKIEARRVPYPVDYPIKNMADLEKMKIPEEASGYLKMYFDINKEAQRRFPDTLIYPVFDGPWDLAMLLRGDRDFPMDFRLYKDYVETDDPLRKDKIRQIGDPGLYPAIMEFTTRLAIQHIRLAKKHGLDLLGATLVDQYATKPILSLEDFAVYVLPYIEKVWKTHDRKIGIGYMYASPDDLEWGLSNETLRAGSGVAGFTNYIFPQTPDGVTLTEFDRPMFELARKFNRSYNYLIHGKFIRDAAESEIEELVKRICGMATQMRVRMSIGMVSIPPGTDLNKIDLVLNLVEKYGRY
ncbi:MAG: uroporphyrinogen decarboxylase family protein, partial [Spirochaetota bacterium]